MGAGCVLTRPVDFHAEVPTTDPAFRARVSVLFPGSATVSVVRLPCFLEVATRGERLVFAWDPMECSIVSPISPVSHL